MIKRLLSLLLILGSPAAFANEGHCMYKQFSPHMNKWYSMCEMPSTAKACDERAMAKGAAEAKFAAGACPTQGVVGGCTVGGMEQFFYGADKSILAKGCERLKGSWQPNLKPKA